MTAAEAIKLGGYPRMPWNCSGVDSDLPTMLEQVDEFNDWFLGIDDVEKLGADLETDAHSLWMFSVFHEAVLFGYRQGVEAMCSRLGRLNAAAPEEKSVKDDVGTDPQLLRRPTERGPN